METICLSGAEWFAVLRSGLGLWRLESWHHKDKKTRFAAGITWAAGIAGEHRWPSVRRGFDAVVKPRPKQMAYLVAYAELFLGLGLIFGFLTPIALVGGLLLKPIYFLLMIHDWAEQGQNLIMALISVSGLFAVCWQSWSVDAAMTLFL